MISILALDTATTTGWAVETSNGILHGSKKFSAPEYAQERDIQDGCKLADYEAWLIAMIGLHEPSHIVLERAFHRGGNTMFLMGLQAITKKVAYTHGCGILSFAPTTIKKFLTGSGRASKEDMLTAIRARGYNPDDDNAADAIALLLYIREIEE